MGYATAVCTPAMLINLFYASLFVIGQVGENVVLPLWIAASMTSSNGTDSSLAIASPGNNNSNVCPNTSNTTGPEPKSLDNFFVLSFASLSFVIIFGLVTLGIILFGRPGTIGRTERKFPHTDMFLIGFCDAINGVMVVFAATASRTSPMLQTLLGNFMIPLTVVARIFILKKKPNLVQGLSAVAVFMALLLCLAPDIFDLDKPRCSQSSASTSSTGAARVLWPLCFMFGFVPAAIMNVLEEKSLKKRVRSGNGTRQINLFYFLFWTSLYQLLTAAALFWIDIIPGFGTAHGSITEFGKNYWYGIKCFFGYGGCDYSSGLRGSLFVGFYVVAYIGGGLLLRFSDGATFMAIVNSVTTPLGFLFWTLFQDPSKGPFMWDPHATTKTYFSLGGLVIMIPFTFIYNYRRAQKSTVDSFDEETSSLFSSSSQHFSGHRINPGEKNFSYQDD
ncbi:uncharacterized protein LOC134178690 [Corticium candelabrum]|uniref:uncharacterized protein LOC134178690 n=1 Tax=Corticium candelabrum TaxID=121492 RepID=UPI002E2678BA|nr:uncharacterized protein LOC134178690 [Corticium candelabrum]